MNLGSYDESAKPMEDYTPLPANEYLMAIEESEVKPCKPDAAGRSNGNRLNLKWRVLEGEHAGRILFHGVNIQHVNPKAQEIGQRELASIRQATGVLSARDSQEFHGIACLVKVAVRPPGPDAKGVHREAQNEVKAIKPATSAPVGQAPQAPPQQQPAAQQQRQYVAPQRQPAAAGVGGKPPWA